MSGAELVRIGSEALNAEVSLLGAELIRLTDAAGRELLWDGDPAVWAGRAPILFPIVGGLAGDCFRHEGRSFSLPKHGFARRSSFEIVECGNSSARFRLEASAATLAQYPFQFQLDITYALEGLALSMRAEVRNRGDKPMPASFGFHPAFRWPLPFGRPRAEHVIRFERAEPAPVRRLDAHGLIDPVARATPVAGTELVLDDDLFTEDAIIFDRLESRSLAYGAEGGPWLDVRFEGMPHLGIWTKPGAGYVCIEPWQGHADSAGYEGEFCQRPGVVIIPPGGERVFEMRVALRL